MDPFDLLMAEHRDLERVMEALDGCAERAEDDDPEALEALGEFARLVSAIDRHGHVAREDSVLVPQLIGAGMRPDEELLAAVKRDHQEVRALASELERVAKAGDPERAVEIAFKLSDLARCHIFTEETRLFPLARAVAQRGGLLVIADAFADFDRREAEGGVYASLGAARDTLVARWGTDAACVRQRVEWAGTDD